jgi:hypothetical protein
LQRSYGGLRRSLRTDAWGEQGFESHSDKPVNDLAHAGARIGDRCGIVSFFSVYGDAPPQGHIAIVAKDRWGKYLRCGNEIDGTATGCYWSSRELWFWPLK